jgi:hypothetical protein
MAQLIDKADEGNGYPAASPGAVVLARNKLGHRPGQAGQRTARHLSVGWQGDTWGLARGPESPPLAMTCSAGRADPPFE